MPVISLYADISNGTLMQHGKLTTDKKMSLSSSTVQNRGEKPSNSHREISFLFINKAVFQEDVGTDMEIRVGNDTGIAPLAFPAMQSIIKNDVRKMKADPPQSELCRVCAGDYLKRRDGLCDGF